MRTVTRITSRAASRPMRFSLALLGMVSSFFVLSGVGTPAVAAAGTVTTALDTARGLPAAYYGVNYDYQTVAPFMNDQDRPAQVAALAPGTIRWPGGVEANSFDWQTGQPMSPAPNGFRFTLQELFNAWQATAQTSNSDAAPMFDLNMTRPISDQITMLQTAQSMGMPVRYVELGNELSSKPDLFANGTVYGATVAADVEALKAEFPDVHVAADGFLGHLGQTPTPVEKTWNHDMLTSASQNGGVPDAVILHAYAPAPAGDLTTSNLGALFGSAYDELGLLDTVISAFPVLPAPPVTQPAVWITEYNLEPGDAALANPPQGTYAHGLFVAAYGLLLRETPRATRNDLWTAFGGAAFGGWLGDSTNQFLSPEGLALKWVTGAAAAADTSTRISFPGGPALPDGNPALVGYGFSSSGASRAVLVNLSGQAVSVSSSSAVPAGAPYQFVTGDPTAQVSHASDLTHGTGKVGSTITLQPYSITLVG